MWRPSQLGTVIAERDLTLDLGDLSRPAKLRVGQPVRSPEGIPWFCPVMFDGLRPTDKLYTVAGEDSLQALVLALDFARKMLPHLAAQEGGKLIWLSDDLDLISPERDALQAYARASAEALHAVRHAEKALRETPEPELRGIHHELAALVAKYGVE
jgi:hypothetical protein